MHVPTLPFAVALLASLTLQAEAAPQKPKSRATKQTRQVKKTPAPAPLPCGDLLSFEVLLDRQGFSSGQIDGTANRNFTRALAAMRSARKIAATGQPDCETWKALGGDTADPAIMTYTITSEDVKGPFEKQIPHDLPEQAKLASLAYRTPLEEIAERFHAAPSLIQKLNPGATLDGGKTIKVPAVPPFDAGVKPPPNDAKPADISIEVSRDESALRAIRSDGTLVLFAPVTTGSEHDPLPTGDWKVNGVQWNPPFHYNPKLFWDAKAKDTKATIKPGPNNPVGVVWIDLSLEHYGLHGTPEPGTVGLTQSHGCVRLTNWDAARVAALVKPGTPVKFR
jgi:lipoprotein-anchoring transpeptidase ErfK/SrfK